MRAISQLQAFPAGPGGARWSSISSHRSTRQTYATLHRWQRLRRRGRDGDDDDDGRHLGLLLGGGGGGCGADGGAAHGAGGVGAEPGVDAVGVEGVRALGQPPHLLPGLHLAEAYRAVERRRLRPVHERRQRGDRVRAHAVVAVRVAHPGREELAALTAAELAAAAAEVPDGEVEEEREDADGEGEAHEEQPRPGAVPRVVRREQPRGGRAHAHCES